MITRSRWCAFLQMIYDIALAVALAENDGKAVCLGWSAHIFSISARWWCHRPPDRGVPAD